MHTTREQLRHSTHNPHTHTMDPYYEVPDWHDPRSVGPDGAGDYDAAQYFEPDPDDYNDDYLN